MTTEERLRETLDMLEQQRRECVRLTTSLTELSERLIVKENELVTARRELNIARANLAEHESVDAKIAAFSKELSRVESMKRNYEKTITTLKARLSDAKRRLGEKDNYDLFETIVMTSEDTARANSTPLELRASGDEPEKNSYPEPQASSLEPDKKLSLKPDKEALTHGSQEADANEIEFMEEAEAPSKREIEVGKLDAALRTPPKNKPPKPGEIRASAGKQDEDDWLIPLPEL